MGKVNMKSDKERAKEYRIRHSDKVKEKNKMRMREKHKKEQEIRKRNPVEFAIWRRKDRLRKATIERKRR